MPRNPLWPEPVERVSAFLRAGAVNAAIHEFPEGTLTAQAAAEAVGCDAGQIVKSLVLMCDGAAVLALVPGDRRCDEAKVAAAVGATRARMAEPAEVLAATGFEPGAVCPFPQVAVSKAYIDRLLFQHRTLWIGGGSHSHMVSLAATDLARLSRAESADLVTPR